MSSSGGVCRSWQTWDAWLRVSARAAHRSRPVMSSIATAASRHPWRIVIVLVIGMSISFFDRGNLAVAAPVIAPELGLSPWSLGILLSAFFWTYSVSQIGAG